MFDRCPERRPSGAHGHALSSCDPDRPETEESFGSSCFDSSLDLRQGLQIIEFATLERLGQELPSAWRAT